MPDTPDQPDRDLSRRDLLRGRLIGGLFGQFAPPSAKTSKSTSVASSAEQRANQRTDPAPIGRRFALPIHRPPGAIDEVAFLSGCTRCGECIAACPVSAIVHAPERFREAAGTPMIDPHAAACIMCDDTPCIASCQPGVLRADQPRKMGVAWIQTMACLAHTGSFCSVCSERCPVPDAIEVRGGKPRIREDVCTGCGVCANVCPAPSNAIVLMPLADRPAPPATAG